MKFIFTKPHKACLSEVAGIFWNTEQQKWIGPNVFDIWGMPKIKKLKIKHFSKENLDKCFEITSEIINEYV